MSDPFIGQIMAVGFNYQPQGWAFCDGRMLSITQNQALFALLNTTFGGDGRTNFGLPDLRGRTAIGMGQGPGTSAYTIGHTDGAETVTLSLAQMPAHSHGLVVDGSVGSTSSPAGANLAQPAAPGTRPPSATPSFTTGTPSAPATLSAGTVTNTGGTTAVSLLQPLLVLNYIIALQGIFPMRS